MWECTNTTLAHDTVAHSNDKKIWLLKKSAEEKVQERIGKSEMVSMQMTLLSIVKLENDCIVFL